MDNNGIQDHPATSLRKAAALARLNYLEDYEGCADLLAEACDPVKAGALIAALSKILVKLALDTGVDLDQYLGACIAHLSAAEAALPPDWRPPGGWVSDDG